MKYTDVKSEFIKKKIKNTSFKKSGYIDDLIFLERSITGKTLGGMGGSIKWFILKNKYPKEVEAIGLEFKPEEYKDYYKKYLKKEGKSRKEDEEILRQEKEEIKRDKEAWIKAGGKL